jgi:hypothetical protein
VIYLALPPYKASWITAGVCLVFLLSVFLFRKKQPPSMTLVWSAGAAVVLGIIIS